MTERDREPGPPPLPPPPGRPRFEFRERPSAALARRATAVRISYGLWLAAATTGLAAALISLFALSELLAAIAAIVERDFPAEAARADRVASIAAGVLVGGGVLVALAQAGFAMGMRSGRGGARFALVVLLAVSVVQVLLSIGVVPDPGAAALLLGVGLGAVASVLMYLPAANLWFAARRP